MMDKSSRSCKDLGSLLSANDTAKEYFMSLPDYVQGMIQPETAPEARESGKAAK